MPNSLTYIAGHSFYGCTNLDNVVIPDSVTYLGAAFYGCDNLKSVILPKGITTLVQQTFYMCDSLTTVTIPENITTIEANAISVCHNVKSLYIPKSVSSLKYQAVTMCENFTEYIVSEDNANYCSVDGVIFSKDKKTLVSFPCGRGGKYTVPDSVTTIGDLSFANNFVLTDVVLGKQVDTIGYAAFQVGFALKSVTIPEKVTSIDKRAFVNCNDDLIIYAKEGSFAYEFAVKNNINVAEPIVEAEAVKSVTHKIVNDKIYFTVITGAGNYNRVKLAYGDDIKGYIAYTNSYTVNADGDYVWTIKADAPAETTRYAFDIRSDETGKYIREYSYYKVTIIDYANDTSVWNKVVDNIYTSSNGGLRMDATGWKTYGLYNISMIPADYNNQGLTNAISVAVYAPDSAEVFAAKTKENFEEILMAEIDLFESTTICGFPAYKAYATDIYYVWVINTPLNKYFINFMQADGMEPMKEIAEQMISTVTIFDGRTEEAEGIKSISHKISNDKIIFTVTTGAGSYNRVKATLADDLKGYIAYSSSYIVNADGDYVWTIKADAPTESTSYAFDIRSDETGKYIREYVTYNVEVVEIFKSVSHEIENGKIIFTIVTNAGNYNRIKVSSSFDPKGYIAYSNDYVINADGDYVWTIKANAPTSSMIYSFDLRSGESGKYIREYFEHPVEVVSPFKSISHEEADGIVTFTIVTESGYNRVKIVNELNQCLVAFTSSYETDADGNCVWTIEINKASTTMLYSFDLRSAETNQYIRAYRYCEV
ncbi:MAG: leucine-rich repeat domain-containing protein, partial [Clostridia bacterium]|nr:leucine-rich repeat domain-containing protein [Clostridia bacterium]